MKNLFSNHFNRIISLIILEIFLLSQIPFPAFSFPGADCETAMETENTLVNEDPADDTLPGVFSRTVYPDRIAILTFQKVMLEIPEGAVTEPVTIIIEELNDIENLNPGMSNMTDGALGYRFKPDGMKFEKEITVTLPYNRDLIRSEEDYISLYTYFYNEEAGFWQRLERENIDKEKGCVTSFTNHFTDLINSTLTLPESPTPLHFNPTSIKDIKAADPGAGINLIEPPQANNQGTANIRFPIEVPPGRNGLQAQAAVQYNSDGGNGWMGLGWDISFSGIAIDTRWGVPRYDDEKETETYVLDGAQLTPLAHRGEPVSREPEKEFHTRIEGEFRKIIRHGANPREYWWEVTDKNGTRFFYGGLPEQGLLADAVLAAGTGGNIFRWPLIQVRDTFGNTVDYEYVIVQDSGIGNGDGDGGDNGAVLGRQLYVKTIRYTGSVGNPGPYSVTFIRDRELEEGRRPDVSIDGRAGFKVVTADLLRKVAVTFNDEMVRCYEFLYDTGAFEKTLLMAIVQYGEDGEEFHRHEFTYYDEVRNDSTYHAFSNAGTWNLGTDNVDTSLLYYDVGSGISLNRSTGENKHLYVGAGPGICPTKNNTAGFKIGHSTNETHGSLAFIDIDGDSLPDKLFNDNGTIYFQKQRLQSNGESVFDIAREVINLHEISKDNTTTISAGAESYFGANIMANYSSSLTTGSNYFSDVNADGLMDFVVSGQVLFNHIEDGIPVFTPDSGDTPHPVVAGAADTDGIIQGLENLYEEMIDNNPLIDSVRVWTAPFSGLAAISAPVHLVPINTEERGKYTTADGVRVAIQKGSQVLWQTDIDAEDYSVKIPYGIDSVQVSAGERIYFRVQSVFDGSFDIVNWHPEITYVSEETKLDANLMDIYSYDSNRDFVLAGRKGDITVPIGGNMVIEGVLEKTGITSDDVRLCVSKNDQTIIEEFVSWNTETAIMINETFHVDALDKIKVSLFIDSPVDLGHISWTSKLSYVSSDNPDIEVFDEQGNSLFTYTPLTNIDLYSNPVGTGAYTGVVMPLTGNITVLTGFTPFLEDTIPPNVNGNVVFTIKKDGELIKKSYTSVNHGIGGSAGSHTLGVTAGDVLFFEFSSRNSEIIDVFSRFTVSYTYNWYEDGSHTVFPSPDIDDPAFTETAAGRGLHLAYGEQTVLNEAYRGWSYFGYNGNRNRAFDPINEDYLKIDDSYGNAGMPDVFVFIPIAEQGFSRWEAEEDAWITDTCISSSRMGTNYIALPETGGGARAVPRIGMSTQGSLSAGVSVLNGSLSTGDSESLLDFFDINGDRFPDILGNGGIQFSNPCGGLEESGESVDGYDSEIRHNTNESTNLGVGMNPVQLIPNNRGTTGGSIVGKMATLMSPIGITLNLVAEGSSSAEKEMMDINGDGLPDIIRQNGSTLQVSLNLGYRFAPFENWGSAQIQESETEQAPFDISFNPSFNVADYSFGGGVSLSNSGSYVEKSLADMNGDGLVDTVRSTGSTLRVGLNTGGGFLPEVEWHGSLSAHISDTDNVTLGGSLYTTISIYIPIPFSPGFTIVINPGGDINTSIGRNQSALRDVNGDGYTDHVTSDRTSRMNVALSTIGRTNKLKQVQRPLGASFTLSYKRDGNTYEVPQCKWVLSEVTIHDGHQGDGTDIQNLTFDYADGYYDRYEREFFGYGSMITERRDEEGMVYMAVTQEFLNDSYYNKGLLLKEQVADGQGNLYTVKANQYHLIDIRTQSEFINEWPFNTIATVFPQLIRSESYFYEGESCPGTWTYSAFGYDNLGNITSFFDAGNIQDPADDVEAVLTYYNDTAHYIVGKPGSIRVYGNGTLLRQREGTYNPATGALEELRQYLDVSAAAESTLDYYPNGNLKCVTGPPNYQNQRYSVRFEYDPEVQTHITKVTDSFGYTSLAEYNYLYGTDISSTDVNGNEMQKVHDNFGRLIKVYSPYDINDPAVEFIYFHEAPYPRAVTKNKVYFDPNNDETLDTVLFIDGLKRIIQTKKAGEVLEPGSTIPSHGMNITGKAVFDFMGRVTAQGQPVFESGYNVESFSSISLKNPTLNEYDILGRTTKVTLPDESIITSAYSIEDNLFKTTTTDPEGNSRNMFKDIKENTVKIEQFNSGDTITTLYEYTPLSEITRVIDDKGNTTTITYDMLGRRTAINNPDAGLVESFFDLAGNLRYKVDNNLRDKGEQITYHYDFNRLAKIDYPESPDVTYTCGQPGAAYNRAGRITRVVDESGTTEFFYGKLGEEIKTVKTMNFLVPGHDPWTFESEAGYDYLGRIQWLTYPDGEKLVYEYDRGGQITSAYGEKQGDLYYYVKQIFYDEFGQRAYIKYGNDVETHYTYDPCRRWLDSINTENSRGEVFQENVYFFDKVGNVLGITNKARDITQTYEYDDIYQLVYAHGQSPDKNKTSTYTQTFAYDSIGNILRKTSEHSLTPGNDHPKELNYDFTYLYNGQRPHAPTQIGNWRYEYDGNGNTIHKERIVGNEAKDKNKENGQTDADIEGGGTSGTYIWNEENRLTEAKVNGRSTYFIYNAGGERTIKRGQHGETLYVNKFYQLQNRSEVTKHVFVGTSRIVSKLSHFHNKNGLYDSGYERKNVYYYHQDHLGSSNYITDPEGQEFEHIEYTPYGETWVDEGTNKGMIGYRFTSKELDTETGLYYFGDRYLDPKVGRWMSVDPAYGDYLPVAPISDKAKERNQNLPGMGGVFNVVNLAVYHYGGNNPVKFIDSNGKQNKDKFAIIDIGGFADPRVESFFITLRLNYYQDDDLLFIEDPSEPDEFQEVLNEINGKVDIIIIAGGHSNEFFSPESFKVDLDNDTQIYFATCEVGLDKKKLSKSFGVPEENIHINEGPSWGENTYNFIIDTIYNDVPVEEAYANYLEKNKYYQNNPDEIPQY